MENQFHFSHTSYEIVFPSFFSQFYHLSTFKSNFNFDGLPFRHSVGRTFSCRTCGTVQFFFSDGHLIGLMRRGIRFLSNSFTACFTITRSIVRLLTKELIEGSLVLEVNSVGVCP
ncbi:hypothetical protein BpHYR1_005022, partial [Brachionus plicatilis]